MQLKEIICYQLFLVQVYPIQTPDFVNIYKNVSIFIEPLLSDLECLKAIISETFRFKERTLISLTVSGIEENTYDLQKMVIKYLNEKGNTTIELLHEPPHPEFFSSVICYQEDYDDNVTTCRNNFVIKESTDFYVIIANGLLDLEKRLYSAFNSTTFNPYAEFLIYWRHSSEDLISDLPSTFWKYQMWNVILAEHEIQDHNIKVHVLQQKMEGPGTCLEKSKFISAGRCTSQQFLQRLRHQKTRRRSKLKSIFKNCTIQVVAMRYEPFVINNQEGMEISLVKQMGTHINVTFDIQMSMAYADWGNKVNGTWDGNFGKIINTLKVGLGNVGPEADRLEDFEFTESYKSPMLVWVVPVAENVEKWRVVAIIFTLELWAVVFSVFIVIWVLLVYLSRFCGDSVYFRSISGGFLSSLQIFISSSVYNTPKTDLVRLVFGGGLLFALIVSCAYCSYLINVLTNAVKQHQIKTVEDILDSNLVIGGLEEYLERFQQSDDDGCRDEICKRYQFFQDENDTAKFWLRKVEERIACTPLTRLFVQYYMVKTFEKNDGVEDGKKRVKLYIIDEPINFYSLAIVLSKGNPFKMHFDRFIKKFIEAGLVYTLFVKYRDDFRKLKHLEEHSDEVPEELSIYHLQAAFAILAIGCCMAILILLMEKLWFHKFWSICSKTQPSGAVARRDPTNRSLYYDWKYGNMYGKNYPREFWMRRRVSNLKN